MPPERVDFSKGPRLIIQVLLATAGHYEQVVVHLPSGPGAPLADRQGSNAAPSVSLRAKPNAVVSAPVLRAAHHATVVSREVSSTNCKSTDVRRARCRREDTFAYPTTAISLCRTYGAPALADACHGSTITIPVQPIRPVPQKAIRGRALDAEDAGGGAAVTDAGSAAPGDSAVPADPPMDSDTQDGASPEPSRDATAGDAGVDSRRSPPAIAPAEPAPPPAIVPSELRNGLSVRGLPGLINVPSATVVPEGSLDLGYSIARDREAFATVDRQHNFAFAVGLLPRLTLGGRGVVATNTDTGRDLARDISANVQLVLLKDQSWWPALALGAQDLSGGQPYFRSYFVVLSKTLFGRLRATAGVGTGPDVLKGPFGGAELALTSFLTVLGEYDGRVVAPALRLFPLPKAWEASGIPRPAIDLIWQDGRAIAWGLSIRTPLGKAPSPARREARAEPRNVGVPNESERPSVQSVAAASSSPRTVPENMEALPPLGIRADRYQRGAVDDAAPLSLQVVSERLQAALIKQGFENVRVTVVRAERGFTVVVEYENRVYNRDELDALGVVMGLAVLRTPAEVTQIRVIVRKVNLAVMDVSTGAEAFLAFINERMPAQAFDRQLRLTQEVEWSGPPPNAEGSTSIRERSWVKLDLFLRPKVDTQILTEVGVADLRFSAQPDAYMQLGPGTVMNARATIPVARTKRFVEPLGDPAVDRVLLHQALPVPIGRWLPGTAALTQVSLGRFNAQDVGISQEAALTLFEGRALVKGTWARLGPSYKDLNRWLALANARVRYPSWNVTLSVTAGRFLDGDRGVAVDFGRFFGDTEVGVFVRHSDHGSLGGLRVALPLTVKKELPPWAVRPRLPDVYAYEQRTTVFTSQNAIRSDIGRELETGHAVETKYWNRDRLYPAYIRQHLDSLQQAVQDLAK